MKILTSAAALALAASLLIAAPAVAQTAAQTTAGAYNGDWTGVLSTGGQTLHLVLHVTTEAGGQTAVIDSVDQGATIPATAIKTDGGELSILFLGIGGELKGKLSADGKTIDGSWTQGTTLPLVLTKK